MEFDPSATVEYYGNYSFRLFSIRLIRLMYYTVRRTCMSRYTALYIRLGLRTALYTYFQLYVLQYTVLSVLAWLDVLYRVHVWVG